jgi:hypothetical protein
MLSGHVIVQGLAWAYDGALHGVAGMRPAQDLAADYMGQVGTPRAQADTLIRWQTAKAASMSLVAGLGSLVTLPPALPEELASAYFVQLRLIAAIAHMGGYDIRSESVRALAKACMCGTAARAVFAEVGVTLGTKVSDAALHALSTENVAALTQKVGDRLLASAAERGWVSFGRKLPLVGWVVSAAHDASATRQSGDVARAVFLG